MIITCHGHIYVRPLGTRRGLFACTKNDILLVRKFVPIPYLAPGTSMSCDLPVTVCQINHTIASGRPEGTDKSVL